MSVITALRDQLASVSDPTERVPLLHRLWQQLDMLGQHAEGFEVATEAHRLARSIPDGVLEAISSRYIGISEYHRGHHAEGRRHLRRAHKGLLAAGREFDAACCLFSLSSGLFVEGKLDEALAGFESALEIFRRLDNRQWIGMTLGNIGVVQWQLHRSAATLEICHEAIDILVENGFELDAATVMTSLVGHEIVIGRYAPALQTALRAEAIFARSGEAIPRIRMLHQIGVLHGRLGDYERAVSIIREADMLAQGIDSAMTRIVTLKSLGSYLALKGDRGAAAEAIASALEIARGMKAPGMILPLLITLGKIALERDDVDGARALVDEIEGLRPSVPSPDILADAAYFLGLLRRREGDRAAAIAELERALETLAGVADPSLPLMVHESLSELYDELGDHRAALLHHRRLAALREEVAGAERQREVAAELMRQQVEEFERERASLRREADELRLEVERKRSDLASMALTVVQKNEALDRVRSEVSKVVGEVVGEARPLLRRLVGSIERSIESESDWRTFENRFTEMHPGFLARLRERFPTLSASEVKVCALLHLELSTKEMAELLSVSTRAIEKHRLNIRRKLSAPKDQPLSEYLHTLA
jgi:tetratricopeptide (TPR) repeat protein/DNA-binding CsgD family transcriptional regulator